MSSLHPQSMVCGMICIEVKGSGGASAKPQNTLYFFFFWNHPVEHCRTLSHWLFSFSCVSCRSLTDREYLLNTGPFGRKFAPWKDVKIKYPVDFTSYNYPLNWPLNVEPTYMYNLKQPIQQKKIFVEMTVLSGECSIFLAEMNYNFSWFTQEYTVKSWKFLHWTRDFFCSAVTMDLTWPFNDFLFRVHVLVRLIEIFTSLDINFLFWITLNFTNAPLVKMKSSILEA